MRPPSHKLGWEVVGTCHGSPTGHLDRLEAGCVLGDKLGQVLLLLRGHAHHLVTLTDEEIVIEGEPRTEAGHRRNLDKFVEVLLVNRCGRQTEPLQQSRRLHDIHQRVDRQHQLVAQLQTAHHHGHRSTAHLVHVCTNLKYWGVVVEGLGDDVIYVRHTHTTGSGDQGVCKPLLERLIELSRLRLLLEQVVLSLENALRLFELPCRSRKRVFLQETNAGLPLLSI